jgi:predicted DNA-binding transcriptional regulator YafY
LTLKNTFVNLKSNFSERLILFELQSKFKRQIEILGLCLSNDITKPFKTFDLAQKFEVEELTIKRDLQELRSYGIDIHSKKKAGVVLEGEIPKELISNLIIQYSSLNSKSNLLDKSTNLLVEKLGYTALSNIVLLQMCIDNSEAAKIDYNKSGDLVESKYIEPLLIYQSEGSWRLAAGSNGSIKQYLIDKIREVKFTGEKFEMIDNPIHDLMKYSWKSWFGCEKIEVKLWMSAYWAERVCPRILSENQKITRNDDGSIIFECTVNGLNEIGGWIAARGEGIIVLEPEELKQHVIQLAEGVLGNYETEGEKEDLSMLRLN